MQTATTLIATIALFDAKADEDADAEQELIVDIQPIHARIWLSSYIAWAMHENKIVEIEPSPDRLVTFRPRYNREKTNVRTPIKTD